MPNAGMQREGAVEICSKTQSRRSSRGGRTGQRDRRKSGITMPRVVRSTPGASEPMLFTTDSRAPRGTYRCHTQRARANVSNVAPGPPLQREPLEAWIPVTYPNSFTPADRSSCPGRHPFPKRGWPWGVPSRNIPQMFGYRITPK